MPLSDAIEGGSSDDETDDAAQAEEAPRESVFAQGAAVLRIGASPDLGGAIAILAASGRLRATPHSNGNIFEP